MQITDAKSARSFVYSWRNVSKTRADLHFKLAIEGLEKVDAIMTSSGRYSEERIANNREAIGVLRTAMQS